MIEVDLPEDQRERVESTVKDLPIIHTSNTRLENGRMTVRLLVRTQDSGHVLDSLEHRFGREESFRAILLNVEATIPRVESEDEGIETRKTPDDKAAKLRFGISREELYTRVVRGTEVSQTYTVTVALSTIVAAIGLWRDDLAVIIGAMVIAPLLGPNVALALATTLADQDLSAKALRANLAGVALALAISLAVGLLFAVDPSVDAIASKTRVGPGDIVLALAAGSAGALAYTTSVPAALIGVMVAVALLPPLVVFGLLLASGEFAQAVGAGMLVLATVISVNLSGVLTFLWQGVQPRTWWEASRARKMSRRALAVWFVLLLLLILVMSGGFRQ